MPPVALAAFTTFRTQLYATFGARQDARFELADALLTTGPVPALPHFSRAPLHRRGWGSLYTALRAGAIDVPALQTLIRAQLLPDPPPIYAVDCSIWRPFVFGGWAYMVRIAVGYANGVTLFRTTGAGHHIPNYVPSPRKRMAS